MNDDRYLGREIGSIYDETVPSREPQGLLDDILLVTSHSRQRPRWLAVIKEPPMRISSSTAVGSSTARIAAIVVATLLLAFAVAGVGVAGSRLLAADGAIVVDPDGDGTVTTITGAVAMADDGDLILVRPGTYDESVTVTKDVTIRGDGDREAIVVELSAETAPFAACDATGLPWAFWLEDSDAILENMVLRGESARVIINGGAPLLKDLELDGVGRVYNLDPGSGCVPTGLDIGQGSTATISDSVLTDTDVDIETGASPSFLDNEFSIGAIWMEGAGVDPLIEGNTITDSVKWGVAVGAGARPEIIANTIVGARIGVDVYDDGFETEDTGSNPVIRGNTISGATSTGVLVDAGATAVIEDNLLAGNPTGIQVTDSDAVVRGNIIQNGRTGMDFTRGGSPIVEGNTIEGAEFGLMIGSGTTPRLTGNTICGNGQNLVISGSAEMPDTTGNEICESAPEQGA